MDQHCNTANGAGLKISHFCKTICTAGLLVFCSLAAATAPQKTLQMMLSGSETGLDPAVASDMNSLSLLENLFDPMLRYDYLVRPVKLQPNTLAARQQVDQAGLTYLFKLQPGIFFTPDPAFNGARREVTAQDYVYSIKRLHDPALKSPWLFLFDDKIVGAETMTSATGKFSYDTKVDGLQALDRHTLRIRLKVPDTNFLFYLAMPATGVVAREVVEAMPARSATIRWAAARS
jgi:ABC-type transport system substrate-binding protein